MGCPTLGRGRGGCARATGISDGIVATHWPKLTSLNYMQSQHSKHSSPDSVSILLAKIHAIAKINAEIITRIRKAKEVISFSYIVKQSNAVEGGQPIFSLLEEKNSMPAAEVISRWKNTSLSLQNIPDVFNDRVDYQLKFFKDVARLNAALLLV